MSLSLMTKQLIQAALGNPEAALELILAIEDIEGAQGPQGEQGETGEQGPPGLLSDNERNIYVGSEYPTVQEAVDYAETLLGSSEGDLYGVTVWIPAGFFDESVLINKNVNLRGAGQDATKLTELTIRPRTTLLGPRVRIFDLATETFTSHNQTTSNPAEYFTSSDGEWPIPYGQNLTIEEWSIINCPGIYLETCIVGNNSDTLVSKNIGSGITLKNTYIQSPITLTSDPEDANAFLLDVANIKLTTINCFGTPAVTITSANFDEENYPFYNASLSSFNSFLGEVAIEANSRLGFRAGGFLTLTVDPTASVSVHSTAGYTPDDPSMWSSVPQSVDEALDTIAESVGPGIGISGSFTTDDLQTVTVVNGIITNIS